VADFKYQIIKKKGFSANASISVSETKGVVVRAPFWMPRAMIESFLEEKSSWIVKHLHRLSSKKVVKKYEEGEKHLFFGKEYSLSISQTGSSARSSVCIQGDTINVTIYKEVSIDNYPEKIKDALLFWYLEKGIEVITEKVNFYSKEMGVEYKKINLKKVSSIWGSCSARNCLSFNRKLVMAPHEIVDYVIIHEVAHMIHRNHGSNFWNLVSKYDSQYKTHRKWLKLNHHLLAI